MRSILFILTLFLNSLILQAQSYHVLESDNQKIIIDINFEDAFTINDTTIHGKKYQYITGGSLFNRMPGDPWLPDYSLDLGIPHNSKPDIKILDAEQDVLKDMFILPLPEEDPDYVEISTAAFNQTIYSINKYFPQNAAYPGNHHFLRYAKILPVIAAPYQFNPVTKELIINKRLKVQVNYNEQTGSGRITADPFTENMLMGSVINFEYAKNWIVKDGDNSKKIINNWYEADKKYYKILLKQNGLYRLTYQYLSSASITVNNLDKVQIYSGNEEVPLYIKDSNSNNVLDEGDYIEFIGTAPPSSPYAYFNVYNNQNVYWLTTQGDVAGKRFTNVDGFPVTWQRTYESTPYTIHYEKDSLYEKLGHAQDERRDYWYWGRSGGTNGTLSSIFDPIIPTPPNILADSVMKIRVNMHGLTTLSCVTPDHNVKIKLTGQEIGTFTFDGATAATFEGVIDLNKIGLFDQNIVQVLAYGDIPDNICDPFAAKSDQILVNWFELEYWKTHRASGNLFHFFSPEGVTGKTRFNVYNWQYDNMKIFMPNSGEIITNADITKNIYLSTLFVVDLKEKQEFYCVSEDYFLTPESINSYTSKGDLKNSTNGADYLIITHEKFTEIAEGLKEFRAANFTDTSISNPRIEVVQLQQIYDEFSYGLVDPYAVRDFIKYAFENWAAPAPSYVVLIGDMSHDYRRIYSTNRISYVPSMPYHAVTYGQAASDNGFAAVSGGDIVPDLAIGRISCETVEEGRVLLDKIKSYPADNGKEWKQNVLLFSSGQNDLDETNFGFNDANLYLQNNYAYPYGFTTSKVFRYPNKPEHMPFKGSGPEIRKAINQGGILANYYGHGGGYQWDLVFNNDDIYQLNNGGRLPFITSVTCYTAHFENQDVFGEQFNKVQGKGSIAFWGGAALTYWYAGKHINELAYEDILVNKNYIIGQVAVKAKSKLGGGFANISQIALLTLLGDPLIKLAFPEHPDFGVKTGDISLNPEKPVSKDTVAVKIYYNNWGIYNPEKKDTVSIRLYVSSADTSYLGGQALRAVTGERDSVIIDWYPQEGGLYGLNVVINEDNRAFEQDHSDNSAEAQFAVYDLSDPNIIEPIDGTVQNGSKLKFVLVDNGYYLSLNLKYFIQIDTSSSFASPLINSGEIIPENGLVKWESPDLPNGKYFWRTRLFNQQDSSKWSGIRVFSIQSEEDPGYVFEGNHLKMLPAYNINYSDSAGGLLLNTSLLPPKPSNDKFIERLNIPLPQDIKSLSTITTDGTYIYFAHMGYYGGASKIYKLGTGFNGSIKGQNYGAVPGVSVSIWHQMFYHPDSEGGHIYAATGDAYTLLKINPRTGDTSRTAIPDGLLRDIKGTVENGAVYISSDGEKVYNVAYKNSAGQFSYTIRTFDPQNGWKKVGDDLVSSDRSYENFTGFFAAKGYFFPYENFLEGYMRRINLENGFYEEEWFTYLPYQGFYAWTYDWVNDVVYASVTRGTPSIFKFRGTYTDASGYAELPNIGPASKWDKIIFNAEKINSSGKLNVLLEGYNKEKRSWDTLSANISKEFSLQNIKAADYPNLRMRFSFVDSSFGASIPIVLKKAAVYYEGLPEVMLIKNNLTLSPDTVMQGYNTDVELKVLNIGKSDADSLTVKFYLNNADTAFYTYTGNVPKDSFIVIPKESIITSILPPATVHSVQTSAVLSEPEYYTFNNITDNSFYVARDSVNPAFSITFDGKEILNGDIVSSTPEVVINLEDNSPLPIDTSFFTINYSYRDKNGKDVVRDVPLGFNRPDLEYTYTPFPNSRLNIKWTPELLDGTHTLEVFARDASGNFFDSTSYRTNFNVFTEYDMVNVLNFPNPFSSETYFTFELRGNTPPEEFLIKVYTVAGRLIRDVKIPASSLQIGFNKIFWDGRDQDGDEIANGVYLYKIISKQGDVVKTATEKLAKVK